MSEITDSSNVGKAMGLLGMQWSLGQTFGPVLGGLLARPAQQHGQHHPFLNQTFFIKCPYFLACMVPVVLGLFIIVPAMMYLPETRPEHKPGMHSHLVLSRIRSQLRLSVQKVPHAFGTCLWENVMGYATAPMQPFARYQRMLFDTWCSSSSNCLHLRLCTNHPFPWQCVCYAQRACKVSPAGGKVEALCQAYSLWDHW